MSTMSTTNVTMNMTSQHHVTRVNGRSRGRAREDDAALIRDGEHREQVETIDPEGFVVSGTSRAWQHLLQHLRATLNSTSKPWTRVHAPFKLIAGANDSVIQAAAQPIPHDSTSSSPACQCEPGQRITGPTCGGGGDTPWRVYGFYFLYDTEGRLESGSPYII